MDVKTLIKKHEGLRLKAYKDSVGKTTIGYGRNLDDKGLSPQEADTLLTNDISDCENDLNRLFPYYKTLDSVRQAVLLDMMFNLGVQGLLQFKNMLAFIATKNYKSAALEMSRSKWATQVGHRASELMLMMETGKWN